MTSRKKVDLASLGVVEDAPLEANLFTRQKEDQATSGALLRAALCGFYDSGDIAADALKQISEELTILGLAVTLDGQDGEGRVVSEIYRAVFDGLEQRARVAAEVARRIREEEELSAMEAAE